MTSKRWFRSLTALDVHLTRVPMVRGERSYQTPIEQIPLKPKRKSKHLHCPLIYPSIVPTPPSQVITVMSSQESQEIWTKTDVYHNSFLIPKDEVLNKIVENNKANGLRDIAVTAAQGKFLHLLARSIGAKKILEVGTLGG